MDVRIDRLVRLEIEGNFLFLAFVREDRADEENEAIRWYTVIKLQALLSTCDRCKHRQPVDARLDVGCGTVFLRKHGRSARDLVL